MESTLSYYVFLFLLCVLKNSIDEQSLFWHLDFFSTFNRHILSTNGSMQQNPTATHCILWEVVHASYLDSTTSYEFLKSSSIGISCNIWDSGMTPLNVSLLHGGQCLPSLLPLIHKDYICRPFCHTDVPISNWILVA